MAMAQSNHKFNAEIYKALMREDHKMVISLCGRVSEHALYTLTIHNDTVLHLATYSKQGNLVLELLRDLPREHLDKLTRQNNSGNTILHETVTSNQAVSIACVLLDKAPGLLGMRNNLGETALFRSARFGKDEIFYFLASKISEYNQASQHAFLQRRDKTTILHIAILSHHFGLALRIAEKYPYIVGERDIDGMTALQILSCNPSAFEKSEPSILKWVITYVKSCYSMDNENELEMQKEKYETVLKLAKLLIRRDTSWEISYPIAEESRPKPHRYGAVVSQALPIDKKGSGAKGVPSDQFDEEGETPLFVATKFGCIEIVREVLKLYPQAVEHIDDEGQNILHVAIKYRQLEIFNLVKKMEIPMRWLVRKLDNKGNTILHMAAAKRSHYVPEKLQGPALELREELLWFERVKKRIPTHLIDHHNSMQQTAEGLLADANDELRTSAKSWVRNTAEGCSVVAVLFATVAFAAAYTVPGGADQETGLPVLQKKTLFIVFTVADVLSLAFSLTAVVSFLSLLSSPYRLEDFKHSLPNKLMLGFFILIISVTMMMVAFAATVLLMIHNQKGWSKNILLAIALLPVCIFALSHVPLFKAVSITYKYLMKKAKRVLPRRAKSPKFESKYNESESINPSDPYRCQCTSSVDV